MTQKTDWSSDHTKSKTAFSEATKAKTVFFEASKVKTSFSETGRQKTKTTEAGEGSVSLSTILVNASVLINEGECLINGVLRTTTWAAGKKKTAWS